MHYTRNLCGYVRKSERKAISEAFRKVYACETREEAEREEAIAAAYQNPMSTE